MAKKLYVTGQGRKIWSVEHKGNLGSWDLDMLPDLPGVTYWAVYQETGETRERSAMRYCFPLTGDTVDTRNGHKVHSHGGSFRLHSSIKAAANLIRKDIEEAYQRHLADLEGYRTRELERLEANIKEV